MTDTTKHDIEKIREALDLVCGSAEFSVRANSEVTEYAQTLSKTLADAIDELEALRNPPDDGQYLDRASLLARIETLTKELDAAKADAARLWSSLDTVAGALRDIAADSHSVYLAEATAALAASDSADWLAKHDEEVRAPLERRIAELEAEQEKFDARKWLVDSQQADSRHLRAQVETLTQQLAAATNDAARAELRARDAVAAIERLLASAVPHPIDHPTMSAAWALGREFLAAAPDSYARLREVVERALMLGARRQSEEDREPDIDRDIDEVLGVKP